jgi:hypothetical protein
VSTTPLRSDDMPAKRDEVVAHLRQLADLVQHDRWEDADLLLDKVNSDFDVIHHTWKTIRQKRREDEHGYEPPRTEQLEACRVTTRWVEPSFGLDGSVSMGYVDYGQRDPDDVCNSKEFLRALLNDMQAMKNR